jgi:CRISPR-associated protein Csm1
MCDDCFAEEQVGRRLPNARYVAFYSDNSGRNGTPIGSFELLEARAQPHGTAQLLLDLEGAAEGDARWAVAGAFRGRHIPHDPATGHALTFEDLARKSTGREALACLKMDVDNLGYLFSQGLKDHSPEGTEPDGERDRTSISRVATLSRTLDVFFAGHLEGLLRADFDDVYLLYSGGDDLAAVGPWNRIFELALRIRDDFCRFTGANPAWSVSAGIAVVNARVPVLLAVEEAEKLLEASKTIGGSGVEPWPPPVKPRGEPQKGRITAFGTSIPWGQYGEVLSQAWRLLGWLQDETLRTAQVRRLLHFAEMAREYQRTHDTNYLQYAPLLVRELRRNWQGANQREAHEWAAQLTVIESETMKSARFICDYALYGNRTQKREDV